MKLHSLLFVLLLVAAFVYAESKLSETSSIANQQQSFVQFPVSSDAATKIITSLESLVLGISMYLIYVALT
jgi:hypothetical protein